MLVVGVRSCGRDVDEGGGGGRERERERERESKRLGFFLDLVSKGARADGKF